MSLRSIGKTTLFAAALASLATTLPAHQAGKAGGPAGSVPRMFHRAARALDLTESQRTAVRGVLAAHAGEIEAQVKARMESRRALRQAAMAQPADEGAIRALAAQAGNAQADGALLFARIRTEILPILTPEQQEKLKDLQARAGGRGDRALRRLDRWLRSTG
jgi:Spy/CpxP family protein refolding chaperone